MRKISKILAVSFSTLAIFLAFSMPILPGAKKMKFAGGSQGLTYYTMGDALGKIGGFNWLTLTTRGTTQNIKMISASKAELGFAQMDILIQKALVKPLISRSVKILLPVYAEELHLLAVDGVDSISDLKGKNVSIGPSGSGVQGTTRLLLETAGLSKSDMTINKSKTQVALQKILIKKELDALFIVAGAPADMLAKLPTIAEKRIHLVEIDDDLYQKLSARYPYKRKTIKSSMYSWLKSDVKSMAVTSAIVGNSSLSSSFVKQLLDKVFKKQSQLAGRHRKWNDLNKAAIKDYVNRYSRYFHPAAAQYLRNL